VSQPYNPYAAPQAVPFAPQGYGGPGQPVPWEPTEVIKLASTRFNRYWFVLVVGYLINLVFTQAVSQGPGLFLRIASPGSEKTVVGGLVQFASSLVGMALGAFFMVGLLRVCLDAARGRPTEFGKLFMGGDRFLPMLGLYVLMMIIFSVGFLLLIVPGIIAIFGFGFAPMYLIDANLGPIDALRASWGATRGQKGKLFGLSILSLGIMVLGLFACGFGVIPATSLVYIAWAVAFTRISGREPAMPDPTWR
jgi:hypothetical protein